MPATAKPATAPAAAAASASVAAAASSHVGAVEAYLAEHKAGAWAKRGPGFVREARAAALETLRTKGFPTTRDEAWRHTSLRSVLQRHFKAQAAPARAVTEAELAPYRLAGAHELVLVDGHVVPELCRLDGVPHGLVVQSLAQALQKPTEDLEHHLGRHADNDHAFVALNTAFLQDGGFVRIAPGLAVDAPIHLLHVATEPKAPEPAASHVRHLVLAGERSEALVVQSYIGLPSGEPGLTTMVTELVAGEGAHLRHVRLQRENPHGYHVGVTAVREDRGAVVRDLLFSVGAALARNEVDVVLGSEGSEVHLAGLFLATANQHVDCPTAIDHAVPHTTSTELYKGVLDGAAAGVFLGKVKVRPDAQKTNSAQTNRNLLLSTRAHIDTTPQLEIHADDVKCAHGSTIGQLSKDALFFLRSRGIGEEHARLILTQAFAHEVLLEAPAPLRPLLEDLLAQWFACRNVLGAAA